MDNDNKIENIEEKETLMEESSAENAAVQENAGENGVGEIVVSSNPPKNYDEDELPATEAVRANVNEVMLFLGEELEPLRRTKAVNVYDLETEYAKTRKNTLWSVWITLGLTFVVVVLVTLFTMTGLAKSNEKIDVNLSSFEDLNLRNLFDRLSLAQEKFNEASKLHAEIKGNFEARLSKAKMKLESDLEALTNLKLSDKDLEERTEQIQNEYNEEIEAVHEEFDAALAAAETEVKQYDEQLKSYDSDTIALTQKWEQQVDSERQTHELEKQRLKKDFEAQLEAVKKDFEERLAGSEDFKKLYEEEAAKVDSLTKQVKDQGQSGSTGAADRGYAAILDSNMIPDDVAGFILNPNGKYGAEIFIRDSYSKALKRNGSTIVYIYEGNALISMGSISFAAGNYYVSFNNDADKTRVPMGAVFKLKAGSSSSRSRVSASASSSSSDSSTAASSSPSTSAETTPSVSTETPSDVSAGVDATLEGGTASTDSAVANEGASQETETTGSEVPPEGTVDVDTGSAASDENASQETTDTGSAEASENASQETTDTDSAAPNEDVPQESVSVEAAPEEQTDAEPAAPVDETPPEPPVVQNDAAPEQKTEEVSEE